MFRFHPRPTIFPSHTTTAPMGTSPASRIRQRQSWVVDRWSLAIRLWGSGKAKGRLADILAAAEEFAVDQRDSAVQAGSVSSRIGFPQTIYVRSGSRPDEPPRVLW